MSGMRTRDQRTLWKGITDAGTIKLGRTSWTRSLYFIAHTSRVPMPTHKHLDALFITTNTDKITREILADSRCHRPMHVVRGDFTRESYPSGPPMVVIGVGGWSTHPERDTILLGFDEHMFRPLHHHLHVVDGCELRGDPWKHRCSWWHAGHPVAVLSGLVGRPVKARP